MQVLVVQDNSPLVNLQSANIGLANQVAALQQKCSILERERSEQIAVHQQQHIINQQSNFALVGELESLRQQVSQKLDYTHATYHHTIPSKFLAIFSTMVVRENSTTGQVILIGFCIDR